MKFREINFAIIQVAKRSKLRKPKWMTFNNTSLELCSMNIPSHPPLFRPLRTFDENKVTRMIFDGIVRTAACSTGVTIGRIDRDPYTCSTPVKNIPNAFHSGEFMTDTWPLLFRPRPRVRWVHRSLLYCLVRAYHGRESRILQQASLEKWNL